MENLIETLKWTGGTDGRLELIDQRLLPGRYKILCCRTVSDVCEAIRTLAVRGAPAIGVSAAYGVCLAVGSLKETASVQEVLEAAEMACNCLAASRPTAVNLFWALQRMRSKIRAILTANPAASVGMIKEAMLEEANAICLQDRAACEAIGQNGLFAIPDRGAVLTHCNAGALATAGIGTALAPMYLAHQLGRRFCVYVDETRPLLQGARLTAWELKQAGIDVVLICDNTAATLMQQGKIHAVITGADRIAANGDTANKVGTLGLSIIAKHYGVPFYVAAPTSTFDRTCRTGADIPIEHRSEQEVRGSAAPQDIQVYNPAFDITPAENITAIITERGILSPVSTETIFGHIMS